MASKKRMLSCLLGAVLATHALAQGTGTAGQMRLVRPSPSGMSGSFTEPGGARPGSAGSQVDTWVKEYGSKPASPAGKIDFSVSTGTLGTDSSVGDILKQHGWDSKDKDAAEMFRGLNPGLVGKGDKLEKGVPYSIISPEARTLEQLQRQGWLVQLNQPDVRAWTGMKASRQVQEGKLQLAGLNASAYASANDWQVHKNASDRLARSGQEFEKKADKLSPSDYVLASDYYEYAAQKNLRIAEQAAAGRKPSARELRALDASTSVLETLLTGKASSFNVRVVVKARGTTKPPPLTVFVLPGIYALDPEFVDNKRLLERLIHYSAAFKTPTTPATGVVDSADARLWVGTQGQYQRMADIVRQGGIEGKYHPVNSTSIQGVQEIVIVWPDGVVQ